MLVYTKFKCSDWTMIHTRPRLDNRQSSALRKVTLLLAVVLFIYIYIVTGADISFELWTSASLNTDVKVEPEPSPLKLWTEFPKGEMNTASNGSGVTKSERFRVSFAHTQRRV